MLPEITTMPLAFLRPLWLLGLIALTLFSLLRYKKDKQVQQQPIIAPHLSGNIVSKGVTNKKQHVFTALAAIACIALSGPTWRNVDMPVYEMEKAQVIAFDLSYSMLATDIKPNRLSQAKFKTIDLIKQWSEGEKALIAYAGDAFTITPLTRDGNAIISHVPNLSPDIMPVPGARADLALDKAIELLKNAGYAQGHIVFISDDISESQSKKMRQKVSGSQWTISVLAVATTQGAPIKLSDGSLLKKQSGEIVVPKLNPQPLYDLANASNGLYLTSRNNSSDINQLGKFYNNKQSRKSETEQAGSDNFAIDDGYWLTFLLLPLSLLLFRKGVFFAFLLIAYLPLNSPPLQASETSIWKNSQQNGYQAYQDEDYQQASELFESHFNQGTALYKSGQYEQALEQFEQVTQAQPDNAHAFYNKGNSYAQLQQFDEAIKAYDEALAIEPDFQQAIKNKTLLEQIKEQQEKEQQNQDKNDQQSQENQDNQDKNEQQSQDNQDKNDQQSQDNQDKNEQQSQDNQDKNDQPSQDNQDKNDQQSQDSQQKNQDSQQDEKQQDNKEQKQQAQEQQQTESEAAENQQQQTQQLQESEQTVNEELEQLPNWLKNMPDDPALLLRNKMRREYQQRAQSQPVQQQATHGVTW